MILNCLK